MQRSKLFFKPIAGNNPSLSSNRSDSLVDSSCTLESTWDSASETYSDDDDSLLAYVLFDPGDRGSINIKVSCSTKERE
jgi:hypothetical protein